jgi:UDP:flavonoid glycosyltransferase YjiC (YdhE family)
MAKILYGINGEGSGHWTRSKEVIEHLKESGHEVTIVTSGRATPNLKKFYQVEEIFGLQLKYSEGEVKNFETFLTNAKSITDIAKSARGVDKFLKNKQIDLTISDFEPISCIVSRVKLYPVISISNQLVLTNTDAPVPPNYGFQPDLLKAGINLMVPNANAYIVLSFFEVAPKNDYVDYIIVYLTHNFGKIAETLKLIDHKFIFYGADKDYTEGNITFKKFDQSEFIHDLAGSAGVLATAGFSLISEALYLKKPFLAWPAKKQFEQTFNAYHLERLGYGKYMEDLNQADIKLFLANLHSYKSKLASYPYRDNEYLFEKLDELIVKLAKV